ncbi:MAG: hypothetical protein P1V97_05455 [Planctomycetota bacterium]|nr:hypothetical protein [Planctomycetota bacterium]
MTNRVAIYSQNAEFRRASQHYLELQGLRVVLRDGWKGSFRRPFRAHTVFLDCHSIEESELRSWMVKCRTKGAQPILCGHWTKRGMLEDLAKKVRAEFFTYPIHPRETLRFITQNQFAGHPSEDKELQLLADIAGLLYKIEGVVPECWDSFEGLIHQRMAEVMVASIEAYGALLISEREELSILAEVVNPGAGSLFRPYTLFATLREKILPTLKASARLYSLAPEDGHEALALAALLASGRHKKKRVFSKAGRQRLGAPIRLEDLSFTPFEFREVLLPLLAWEPGEEGESGGIGRLNESLAEYLCETPGEDVQQHGPFELVICRRLDELYQKEALESSIRALTECLVASGLLVLAPGESILMSDVSLRAQQLGNLTVYVRLTENEKGVLS